MRKRLECIANGRGEDKLAELESKKNERGESAGLCLRGIHKLDMRRVLAKLSNLNRNKI